MRPNGIGSRSKEAQLPDFGPFDTVENSIVVQTDLRNAVTVI
jgi:hypothetical protein